MQIHEMITQLTAAGHSEETARELAVFALQAHHASGWKSFEPRPEYKTTKAEASRIFSMASIDPDEIEMPSWYDN